MNIIDWVLERLPADNDELYTDWVKDPSELEQALRDMRDARMIACCGGRWYRRETNEKVC